MTYVVNGRALNIETQDKMWSAKFKTCLKSLPNASWSGELLCMISLPSKTCLLEELKRRILFYIKSPFVVESPIKCNQRSQYNFVDNNVSPWERYILGEVALLFIIALWRTYGREVNDRRPTLPRGNGLWPKMKITNLEFLFFVSSMFFFIRCSFRQFVWRNVLNVFYFLNTLLFSNL